MISFVIFIIVVSQKLASRVRDGERVKHTTVKVGGAGERKREGGRERKGEGEGERERMISEQAEMESLNSL